MADDFDFITRVSFRVSGDDIDKTEADRRRSFRAVPPGVRTRLSDSADETEGWRVNDISAGGISIDVAGEDFHTGQELELDILIAGKLYLHKLRGTVVRNLTDEVACAFRELTRNQEAKLDKLILEMQKRFIIQRKLEREVEEMSAEANPIVPDEGPVYSIKLST